MYVDSAASFLSWPDSLVDGGRLPVIQVKYEIFTPEIVKPNVTIFIPEKEQNAEKCTYLKVSPFTYF